MCDTLYGALAVFHIFTGDKANDLFFAPLSPKNNNVSVFSNLKYSSLKVYFHGSIAP